MAESLSGQQRAASVAEKITIERYSDLQRDLPADETVAFGLDGAEYEIDLTEEEAARLRDGIAEFTDAARRMGGKRRRGLAQAKAVPAPRNDVTAVREWARDQGYEVSDRGRIPIVVQEAYARSMRA
jgi:hypothetical protein